MQRSGSQAEEINHQKPESQHDDSPQYGDVGTSGFGVRHLAFAVSSFIC